MYGFILAEQLGGNPHPPEPQNFGTQDAALEAFRQEATEHFRFSNSELTLTLFEGEPEGDEATYGYPDYPDKMFCAKWADNDFTVEPVAI